jgi:hypothetical protein
MITESISCVSERVAGADLNTSNLIDNLLDVNTSKEIVHAPYTAIKDIQLDLASFIFGLSELYMRVDRQSKLGVRIFLLKKCVEDTKSKIDRLVK